MTATPSPVTSDTPQFAAPDSIELAALLCSRVCHDLISPVGAIVNGLEVLDDAKNEDDKEFALDLIRKSARNASARLQFCRLAFGAAGSASAQIDTGDAENMARGFMEDDRTKIVWTLPRAFQPKNRVKLLLNMLIIAQQTIPRGGTLTVETTGEGDTQGMCIRAKGLNARLPQNIADQLSGAHRGTIDAHAVQPYYTRLLAEACKLRPMLALDGDAIAVTAV
jgi:histidine phosphotransferase ChpT